MGMIGNPADNSLRKVANDSYNGDGSTTVFTLSAAVNSATDIEVLVDNVQQSPYDGSYTASGTTLTFSEAPASGTNNIYVIYHVGRTTVVGEAIPQDGSVTPTKLDRSYIPGTSVEGAMTTPYGRRNLLINAGFQVSQRGDFTSASSSTNGAYFVDRWLSAQDVITANKQHLYNQTITSSITANTLKIIATSSGTGNFQLSQPIERVNQDLGNKTLTYSVWVKTNNSNVRLRGIFDDSGWTQFDAVHTGDGTWQKLSTTFTTGATRSAGHYQIQILAYNNGNVGITSGDYIEIAHPQIEIGTVATPFEHRSFGEELALCQRYYWRLGWPSVHNAQPNMGLGFYLNNARVDMAIDLPVTMRTTPAIVANSGSGYWNAYVNGDDLFDSWSGVNAPTNSTFIIYSTNNLSGSAGNAVLVGKKDSAASLAADAEL